MTFLYFLRAVCAKLKKIEHVELINKDWADKAGKKEGEKKVAEEDNKEVNKEESMEESMDCEEEKGGDSEAKQAYEKKGDEGEKDSNKKKVDSKDKKVEKDEKNEGKKEEVTDKTKEVILKICKAGDVAKALSQFYMEVIRSECTIFLIKLLKSRFSSCYTLPPTVYREWGRSSRGKGATPSHLPSLSVLPIQGQGRPGRLPRLSKGDLREGTGALKLKIWYAELTFFKALDFNC